jgi:hypothetical protein
VKQEIDEEQRLHLELRAAENMAAGRQRWSSLFLTLVFTWLLGPLDAMAGDALRIAVNTDYPPWRMRIDGGWMRWD